MDLKNLQKCVLYDKASPSRRNNIKVQILGAHAAIRRINSYCETGNMKNKQ